MVGLDTIDTSTQIAFSNLSRQHSIASQAGPLGTKPITIPPNSKTAISGQARVKAVCQRLSICLEEVQSTSLPKGLLVSPCVAFIEPGRASSPLAVEVVHHSSGLLMDCHDIFSQHNLDLGCATKVKHHIHLTSDVLFKECHRRIPYSMYEEVRAHLKEMQDLKVIRKSESLYASGVVLVCKKNGYLRFRIDLRRLNAMTVRDSHSLPRIEETLDSLHGLYGFHPSISKVGIGKLRWQKKTRKRPLLQLVPLASGSGNACRFDSQMLQQRFSA